MVYTLDEIVSWAKRKGFVFQGSSIYGGLANAWDLGPYGTQVRKNIIDLWRKNFVQKRNDMVGLDSQILMHPKVWEASGHLGGFSDPLVDDKKTGKRYRADKIIEDEIENQLKKHSEEDFLQQLKYKIGVDNFVPESWGDDKMYEFLIEYDVKNPDTGDKAERTSIRQFNLMYKTRQGVVQDSSADIYLRPETAQGIFINFKNILDTTRVRIPFGIAQIGKVFRNEITPKQFLFRPREFEQLEIEYFVENNEDKAMEYFETWKEESYKFFTNILGISESNLRFRDHEKDELSHYSNATVDIEYNYPWGRDELEGIAFRTDFDLTQHMNHSGEDIRYTDTQTGQKYVPYVVEPSFGLTRSIFLVFAEFYDEETYKDPKGNQQERVVVRFPFNVAPVKFAVMPLIEKNNDMVAKANEIFNNLTDYYNCELDTRGAIGKRYRRQDEIGTPYCVTIDHQTLDDGTVTIRYRDSMDQVRIKIDEILNFSK